MNNTVIPYTIDTDSGEESDSSNSSEEGNLITNNLGVVNKKFIIKDERFLNQEKVEDYQNHRNKLFTPEIDKKIITVFKNDTDLTKSISLLDNFKIRNDNIIGFKILRSSFITDSITLSHFDLSISEIPTVACDINESGEAILARVPLSQVNTNIFYNYHFREYANVDRYFYPITLNNLTLKLSENLKGYFIFEISYLNQ